MGSSWASRAEECPDNEPRKAAASRRHHRPPAAAVTALVAAATVATLLAAGDTQAATVTLPAGNNWFCDASYQGGICETTVNVGDTVTWEMVAGTHTVTECDDTFSNCPPTGGGFSEAQFNIGTGSLDPCGNDGWPAELAGDDNRVKLQDVTSFAVPAPRKLNTSPGMTGFDSRWDLVPGQKAGLYWISLQDITALTAGPTAFPPMLGGARAFNGPTCPYPP